MDISRGKWKWNLTEVSSHDEAISAQKKLPDNIAAWTPTARREDRPEGPMAPIVTTGILIVENLLTRHPCARGHFNLSVPFH